MDDLERWTRVLPLGAGAFGEVHLAWDTVDGRWVAVKRFTGQDELGLLRMVIESRIRVSHPHLVHTLAFRLVDDRAWLVTELARGGSLRGLMSRVGALPWGWVAAAVDQILSALTALHATGVVHRDLKPANLLLRSHGATFPHLLVGDFGIATWRTVSMTGIGAAIGTPGYLAPEYLDGHQPSPATDLFAVGVLAAELLFGKRPVHYSNASPMLPATWTDVLPLPPDVPAGLAAVLRRMADPDPARRYRDCTQAREALLTAAPPERRGDLTTVTAPDLLAAVPPGWTESGPEQGTTVLAREQSGERTPPAEIAPPVPDPGAAPAADLSAIPIDGGPTALVTPSPEPAGGLPTIPPTPPAGQVVAPAVDPAAAPPPAGFPAGSPAPAGRALPPRRPTARRRGQRPVTPATARRRAGWRAKARRAATFLVVLVLAVGAGTLWWAAGHRTVAGQGSAVGGTTDAPERASQWVPTIVEACSRVQRGSERAGANGNERCQRTRATDAAQHWVEEPPSGFPKSDPSGPFPAEPCGIQGEREYSPVGDHLVCQDDTWQIIP